MGETSNASPLTKAMFTSSDHGMDGGIGHFTAKPSSLAEMSLAATSSAQGRSYDFESLNAGTIGGVSASVGVGENGERAGQGEGAKGSHQPEDLEAGGSLSSLPVSIPEELRCVAQFMF